MRQDEGVNTAEYFHQWTFFGLCVCVCGRGPQKTFPNKILTSPTKFCWVGVEGIQPPPGGKGTRAWKVNPGDTPILFVNTRRINIEELFLGSWQPGSPGNPVRANLQRPFSSAKSPLGRKGIISNPGARFLFLIFSTNFPWKKKKIFSKLNTNHHR